MAGKNFGKKINDLLFETVDYMYYNYQNGENSKLQNKKVKIPGNGCLYF